MQYFILYDIASICLYYLCFFFPHRLVLSSVSDYFAAMFTSDVCEAKQEEIKMEGIDPAALWDLVQFAYTGIVMQAVAIMMLLGVTQLLNHKRALCHLQFR